MIKNLEMYEFMRFETEDHETEITFDSHWVTITQYANDSGEVSEVKIPSGAYQLLAHTLFDLIQGFN